MRSHGEVTESFRRRLGIMMTVTWRPSLTIVLSAVEDFGFFTNVLVGKTVVNHVCISSRLVQESDVNESLVEFPLSNERENEREPHERAGNVHGTYESRSAGRPE
jgi:hypothetical protein